MKDEYLPCADASQSEEASSLSEEEALAALLVLGEAIEWDVDCESNAFARYTGYCESETYTIHCHREILQFVAFGAEAPGQAIRRTLPLAKAACEYHRATGAWAMAEPEAALEWIAGAGQLLSHPVGGASHVVFSVGRGIVYTVFAVRWLGVLRRYRVWSDAHQCCTVRGRVVTREAGFAASDLPDCGGGVRRRRYRTVGEAKGACERHHATGMWE